MQEGVGHGQGQARPQLSRLAADMRSRVRRSLRDAGAAECAGGCRLLSNAAHKFQAAQPT